MRKKSLRQLLQFQWWSHTVVTSVFFIASTFFLLFAVEDYYHESQLIDLSHLVANQGSLLGLPEHVQAYPPEEVPDFIQHFAKELEVKKVVEIETPLGNKVHVTTNYLKDEDKKFFLISDESKTKSIFRNIDKILLMLMPLVIVFLLLATLFSKRFTHKLQEDFTSLLDILKNSDSSKGLYEYPQNQPIKELSEFSLLFAKIWDEKLEILSREREGLEYLSHELRTPIQTSKATLELLTIKHGNDSAIQRIDRSINRMTRLSNAILCLMESDTKPSYYEVNALEICNQLIEEFSPLTHKKNQEMELIVDSGKAGVFFYATKEVLETIISILLMNAIQHSNRDPILVYLHCDKIVIQNQSKYLENHQTNQRKTSEEPHTQSYGIGLVIAKRLSNLISMALNIEKESDGKVVATLRRPA